MSPFIEHLRRHYTLSQKKNCYTLTKTFENPEELKHFFPAESPVVLFAAKNLFSQGHTVSYVIEFELAGKEDIRIQKLYATAAFLGCEEILHDQSSYEDGKWLALQQVRKDGGLSYIPFSGDLHNTYLEVTNISLPETLYECSLFMMPMISTFYSHSTNRNGKKAIVGYTNTKATHSFIIFLNPCLTFSVNFQEGSFDSFSLAWECLQKEVKKHRLTHLFEKR